MSPNQWMKQDRERTTERDVISQAAWCFSFLMEHGWRYTAKEFAALIFKNASMREPRNKVMYEVVRRQQLVFEKVRNGGRVRVRVTGKDTGKWRQGNE